LYSLSLQYVKELVPAICQSCEKYWSRTNQNPHLSW